MASNKNDFIHQPACFWHQVNVLVTGHKPKVNQNMEQKQ